MAATDPDETPDARADENASRKRGLIALLALLVVLIVACCLIASTQTGIVPDVTGMTVDEAVKALEDAGFELDLADGRSVDDISPDAIVATQTPEGGKRAMRGTRVMVTIEDVTGPDADGDGGSPGSGDYSLSEPAGSGAAGNDSGAAPAGTATSPDTRPVIPSVGNLPEASAVSTLRNAGYRVVIGGYGPTTSVGEGRVYFQEPPFGSRAARGSTVTLWISSGAPHEDGYQGVPYPGPTNP